VGIRTAKLKRGKKEFDGSGSRATTPSTSPELTGEKWGGELGEGGEGRDSGRENSGAGMKGGLFSLLPDAEGGGG